MPIIIFHPGSKHLRIGISSDPSPITVLHAVGRRRTIQDGVDTLRKDNLFPNNYCGRRRDGHKPPPEVESARLQLCYTLQTALRSDGKSRFATPTQTIAGYNQLCKEECQESAAAVTNVLNVWEEYPEIDVIFGDDIFRANPDGDFNIHFPWRRGQLNVHCHIGGSLSWVINDICDIWSHWVMKGLQIPLGHLKVN